MALLSIPWWLPFGTVPEVPAPRLAKDLAAIPPPQLVDVRTATEFRGGRIPGAISAPITSLARALPRLGLDPSRKVRIACIRTARMLMYRIQDPGPGFRPNELSHAAVSNPPDKPYNHLSIREERGLRPGGFGLLMTRAMVDELVYNEAHNEVVFVKYLE